MRITVAVSGLFAIAGCQAGVHDLTYGRPMLPALDRLGCVRVTSIYYHNPEKPGQRFLSKAELAWLRRSLAGRTTDKDTYDSPPITSAWGTVVEVCDRERIEEIGAILEEALLECTPVNWSRAYWASWASVEMTWRYGKYRVALPIEWWTDTEFVVAHGTDEECVIVSPELAALLKELARKQSLHTWVGSNPELVNEDGR